MSDNEESQLCKDIKASWKDAWEEFMNEGPPPLIYRGPIGRVEVPVAAPVGVNAEIQPQVRNHPDGEERHDEVQVVAPAGMLAAAPVQVPVVVPMGVPAAAPVQLKTEPTPPASNQLDGEPPRLPIDVVGNNALPVAHESKKQVVGSLEEIAMIANDALSEFLAILPSKEDLDANGKKLDETIAGLLKMETATAEIAKLLLDAEDFLKRGDDSSQQEEGVLDTVCLAACGEALSNSLALLSHSLSTQLNAVPSLGLPLVRTENNKKLSPNVSTSPKVNNKVSSVLIGNQIHEYEEKHVNFRLETEKAPESMTKFESLLTLKFKTLKLNVPSDYVTANAHQKAYFTNLRLRMDGKISEHWLDGLDQLSSYESNVLAWDSYFLTHVEKSAKAQSEAVIRDYLSTIFGE